MVIMKTGMIKGVDVFRGENLIKGATGLKLLLYLNVEGREQQTMLNYKVLENLLNILDMTSLKQLEAVPIRLLVIKNTQGESVEAIGHFVEDKWVLDNNELVSSNDLKKSFGYIQALADKY